MTNKCWYRGCVALRRLRSQHLQASTSLLGDRTLLLVAKVAHVIPFFFRMFKSSSQISSHLLEEHPLDSSITYFSWVVSSMSMSAPTFGLGPRRSRQP
eukprot:10404593-Heterocapsa_arctica.AAC.1